MEPDSKAERKKQAAEEGFKQGRQLLLALKFDALGGPPSGDEPWSSKQGMMFNQLQNQFYFETGYKPASPLSRQEGGQNQAFWVENTEYDNKGKEKQVKQRLFKPADGEQPLFGDAVGKPGMAAIRESLASSTSKLIAEQTGLDLGVPETSVVGISGFALQDGKRGETKLGSVQQFEKTDGELKGKDPSLINRIPKDDWHRCAIQDIISLNADRHSGNFMVQKTDDPAVRRLVPIDHGNTMPSPGDFKTYASDFAGCKPSGMIQNASLQQEKSYEPFSNEMLEAISRIDPDALADGLRQHCTDLDEVNPGLRATENFPSDAIELSKRTTIFLKAAAPYLSPAEIMLAISAFKEDFADLTVDIDDLCQRVLEAQLGKGEAYKDVMLASLSVRQDLLMRLEALGWDKEVMLRTSPDVAYQLLVHNAKNDPKPRDPQKAVKESDLAVGTRTLIDSVLSKTEQDVGRFFLLADKEFPAIKESETERLALETVQVENEADAKSAHKRAIAYKDARRKAIADSLLEQAKRIYDAHHALLEGEQQTRLINGFGNVKTFHESLNLNSLSQNLETLREVVRSVSERPTGPVIEKLADSQRYIEPQVKAGEERLKQAQSLLTAIRADAAKAVGYRRENREDRIGAVLEEATTRQTAYDQHLERSKNWLDTVTNTFLGKMPRDNELTPAYAQDKKNLDMLQLKIVQDIDAIDFFRQDVGKAMALIGKAGDGNADQNALLAEVVSADQETAQAMVLKAGQLDSGAATDFDGLGEALVAAKTQGVEESVRKRHVATARKLIQEAIGKLNTLKQELTEADDFMKNARAGYPEDIDRNEPPFKIPFEELQKVQDKWGELMASHARLSEKAKKLGQEILTLM